MLMQTFDQSRTMTNEVYISYMEQDDILHIFVSDVSCIKCGATDTFEVVHTPESEELLCRECLQFNESEKVMANGYYDTLDYRN